MASTGIKGHFRRHEDDEWFDEVLIVGEDGPVARIWMRPRYKTSELSGDEWRVSAEVMVLLDDEWVKITHTHTLDAATRCLFHKMHDQPASVQRQPVTRIDLLRKGIVLTSKEYDDSLPLLTVAGLLAWEFIILCETHVIPQDWDDKRWCFQPGCANEAVSTYRLEHMYCRCCGATQEDWGQSNYRRFCKVHLRRGDCGMEDSDYNYEVVEGPGPDDAEGDEDFISPSVNADMLDFVDDD